MPDKKIINIAKTFGGLRKGGAGLGITNFYYPADRTVEILIDGAKVDRLVAEGLLMKDDNLIKAA